VPSLDALLGDGLERLVLAHHRRRLRRLGHEACLDPAGPGFWAAGDPPPREGSDVEVLIDGARAFPRMLQDLRAAKSHVHVAGWHVAPDFALTRDGEASQLRRVLGELAERLPARVLVWGGAPLRGFTPSRGEVKQARAELVRGNAISCALDPHERTMHCHHEKLVIVDDEVAYVGGIDITSLGGDRFDSSEHAERGQLGWHDVGTRLRGPIVGDVARHFAARWTQNTGEELPEPSTPPPTGSSTVQLVRTVCEGMYDFAPRGDFRLLEAYRRALGAAEHLIYLENQFLWAPEITKILVRKLRDPPTSDFRVVVLLPAKPNNGADDTRGQLELLAANDPGGRFLPCTIHARSGARSGPLYVHAKVGIVDDRWLTVGSANLNAHSLFNDSEVNVITDDRELARATRLRLWAEHLECSEEGVSGPAAEVIDRLWRPIADEQLARQRSDQVLTHRLMRLEASSKRLARLRGPLDGLLVDG
jgi:phosphatidylserine/phosphatidylglycerophosphate/cardiolipin synthase-like enzyme